MHGDRRTDDACLAWAWLASQLWAAVLHTTQVTHRIKIPCKNLVHTTSSNSQRPPAYFFFGLHADVASVPLEEFLTQASGPSTGFECHHPSFARWPRLDIKILSLPFETRYPRQSRHSLLRPSLRQFFVSISSSQHRIIAINIQIPSTSVPSRITGHLRELSYLPHRSVSDILQLRRSSFATSHLLRS
jgi:hypothetical protein